MGMTRYNPTGVGMPAAEGLREGKGPFSSPINPRKAMNSMLANQYELLQTDPNALGLSEAEKLQMGDTAAQNAAVTLQSGQAELGRQALGGTPVQQGVLRDASQKLGEGTEQARSTATMQAEGLSQAKIAKAQMDVTAGLEAERMKRKDSAEFLAQYSIDSMATLSEMYKNLMGGMSGMVTGGAA